MFQFRIKYHNNAFMLLVNDVPLLNLQSYKQAVTLLGDLEIAINQAQRDQPWEISLNRTMMNGAVPLAFTRDFPGADTGYVLAHAWIDSPNHPFVVWRYEVVEESGTHCVAGHYFDSLSHAWTYYSTVTRLGEHSE